MPYVPSKKTDGKSDDRIRIDEKVEVLAKEIATGLNTNFDILNSYKLAFRDIFNVLQAFELHGEDTNVSVRVNSAGDLARTIYDVAKKYEYQGAFLGELNYAITRLIQLVPKFRVSQFKLVEKEELRYWLYAVTVEALAWAAAEFITGDVGVGGVFEDIKDEYKRRVNVSYEAAQIIKSGDCYDAPYYTRLVEIVDTEGNHVGYQEVMLKRSEETLNQDVLDGSFVLQRKTVPVAQ